MKTKTVADTSNFLSSLSKKSKKPSDMQFYLYVLALEFNITDITKYPIPYLESLVTTHLYL